MAPKERLSDDPHLWVSVKQTADGRPDNRLEEEGSGEFADSWLHAHPGDQVTCDGSWQTQTFTIDTTNGSFPGKGELTQGQGYVQFCLFGEEGAFTSSERFIAVR